MRDEEELLLDKRGLSPDQENNLRKRLRHVLLVHKKIQVKEKIEHPDFQYSVIALKSSWPMWH